MKKIILASNSPQRKKLLKDLGVSFKVMPSKVQELKDITSTCSALVKHNAGIKAEDAAKRLKEGIVIGADTLVYAGGMDIIGKPRNHRHARQMLRGYFRKAHWVYTGVAVIDAQTGKKLIDYEKTRIYMQPLTDKDIDRYHAKVNPLDKAGGFDIEGFGSLFIRRIEGCYTNVIGLPIPKLFQMLKIFGVNLL